MRSSIKLEQPNVTVEISFEHDEDADLDDVINTLIKPALYGAGYGVKFVDEYFAE